MIKKHFLIMRQCSLDATDEYIAEKTVWMQKYAQQIQDYYRFFTKGFWDVQAFGAAMRGDANAHPPTYAYPDVQKWLAENSDLLPLGFEPNYFHVVGGTSGGYCGQGTLGGNKSVTYLNYSCGVKTMIHEIGHNLGMHHAATMTDDGNYTEYGDSTSIMSSSQAINGLTAPHLNFLGVEADRETLHITETKQVLLAPLEVRASVLRENEYCSVRVEKPSPRGEADKTFISIRNGYGYKPDNGREKTVYVQQLENRNHSIRLLADLKVGQSRTLDDGTTVEYLEYKDQCARVNIIYNEGDAKPADIPMPTEFVAPQEGATIGDENSGAWYDKDFNGQGLHVMHHDNRLVVYWYTYNTTNDSRRYYYGVCNEVIDGEIPVFEIFTTSKGYWSDPTRYQNISVGTGRVEFVGNKGRFLYHTTEHGRGSMELDPVALSVSDKAGAYYQPSRNGEGFTIDFFRDDSFASAYWYSYGPPPRQTFGSTVIDDQRWYLCYGDRQDNGTYAMKIIEVDNGGFLRPAPVENVDVGNAVLTVLPDGKMQFDYNINTIGNKVVGNGTFLLERLF